MIAGAPFTIVDLNDPIQQGAAPADPVSGMLWLDTSSSPPLLKRYNGTEWEDVGDSGAGAEALEAVHELEPIVNDAAVSSVENAAAISTLQTQIKSTVSQTTYNIHLANCFAARIAKRR